MKTLLTAAAALLSGAALAGTPVAKIGDTTYSTLAEALIAATSGDTIELFGGTYGANEIGALDEAGKYTNANLVRYKSLTIQPIAGATVTFTSNLAFGYDDSSTANASMTVKGLHFQNASLQLSNYVTADVEDCTFSGAPASSSPSGTLIIMDSCCKTHKPTGTSETFPTSLVTVKNCTINGSAASCPGMRIRNSGNLDIEGNIIMNTDHNGILFESNSSLDNTNAKTIIIKHNTFTEWNVNNAEGGGRAIRGAFASGSNMLTEDSTLTIENNTFRKATTGLDTPDFIKLTGVGLATVSLDYNDWNDDLYSVVYGDANYYTVDGFAMDVATVVTTKKTRVMINESANYYSNLTEAVSAASAGDSSVEVLENIPAEQYTDEILAKVRDYSATIKVAKDFANEILPPEGYVWGKVADENAYGILTIKPSIDSTPNIRPATDTTHAQVSLFVANMMRGRTYILSSADSLNGDYTSRHVYFDKYGIGSVDMTATFDELPDDQFFKVEAVTVNIR